MSIPPSQEGTSTEWAKRVSMSWAAIVSWLMRAAVACTPTITQLIEAGEIRPIRAIVDQVVWIPSKLLGETLAVHGVHCSFFATIPLPLSLGSSSSRSGQGTVGER